MTLQRLVVVEHRQARHIKTRNPHVNDNGDAEIRPRFLKLTVEHLAVCFIPQKLKHVFRIIASARRHHVHHREALIAFELRLLFWCIKRRFICNTLRLKPFRPQHFELLMKAIGNRTRRRHNHGL